MCHGRAPSGLTVRRCSFQRIAPRYPTHRCDTPSTSPKPGTRQPNKSTAREPLGARADPQGPQGPAARASKGPQGRF
eukprot:8900326-Alexandrium_andersonii.AAC.1